MSRPHLALAAVGLLVVCSVPAAFATPAQLDPPDVGQVLEATSIVHLDVTAGQTGAPNGFTIEWIPRVLYDMLGGWPTDSADPNIRSAIYLGSPTLNTVEGTTSFLLGPNEMATVEIGDIFDETGVLSSTGTGEMAAGTEYAVRVRANGDGGMTGGSGNLISPSSNSGTYFCHTKPNDGLEDCVHSQGYWKTHSSVWPVSTLKLGNIIYTKTQLLAIWNTPAAGNGLISLAHQLMAAKLNILSGAQAPSLIVSAVNTADALIGNLIIPPIGAGYLAPGVTSHLTDDLEEFNTEENGDVQCQAPTEAQASTWGRLKARYR
jgi:hypothetical protein